MSKINLRCAACGNAKRVDRIEIDPPAAVECETNECSICHAASGGFGEETYYDRAGNKVWIE